MAVVLKVQRPHQLNPEVQIHSPHRPTRWGALGFSPATCLLITLQVTLVQTNCDPLPCSSSPRSSLEADIFLLVFDVPDDCGPCCRTDECACLTFLGTVSPVPGVSQLHGCVIRAVTGPHSQSSEFAVMLCSSVLTFLILLSLILFFMWSAVGWWNMLVGREDTLIGSMYGLRRLDAEGWWSAHVLCNWPGCPVPTCMPGAV